MAGARIAAQSQSNALVSSIDIMPTVLELAGVASAESMQGKSFVSLFKNTTEKFPLRSFFLSSLITASC
jgi:arylsulfatase A-like enzyme